MNHNKTDSEHLRFSIVAGQFAVCRLFSHEPIPAWAHSSTFSSITRTPDELSIICPTSQVPSGIQAENGWTLLKLQGPFTFDTVGVLRSVACALAEVGVSILTVGTFDTDYILIKQTQVQCAVQALEAAGHKQMTK